MTLPFHGTNPLDAVRRHPRLDGLARTPTERERLEAFAYDLARWLVGETEGLMPLVRVVTRVAQRELRDPRQLCHQRPLLAVEAAARATQALWPWLRGPLLDPPPSGGSGAAPPDDASPDADAPAGAGASRSEDDDASDGDDVDGDGDADAEAEGDADAGGDADGDENEDENENENENGDEDEDEGEGEGEAAQAGGGPLPADEADPPGGDRTLPVDADQAFRDLIALAGTEACTGALEAERVARHLERFLPGIGWSSAPGRLDRLLLDRLDRLVALLDRSGDLQRLADALGRIEDASRRAGPQGGGSEEVVGVHLGGEVAQALPAELALLADDDTEDLFYQRLLERRLLSLELTGAGIDGSAEGDRRGPVIACIDTSASMEGAPEWAAKAIVLAICRRVLPQGRAVHLLLFGAPGEKTELRLRRGSGGLEGLLDFLGLSFHAGTDFDTPLGRAIELLDEHDLRRADVLVVTDGLCRASAAMVEEVLRSKAQRGVRVWSVVLGNANPAGVTPFSDDVWQLDPDSADVPAFVRRLDA